MAEASLSESLNSILLNPAYHDPLAIVKAARNGLVYGTKIRFPHALVMVLLFRAGTPREKATAVLKATRQHATNLATFALIYKSLMLLLRRTTPHLSASAASSSLKTDLAPRPRSEPGSHSFFAGLAAGYWVFGRNKAARSSVNQQIVIYVFARVVLGLAKLVVQPAVPAPSATQAGYGDVSPGGLGVLDAISNGVGLMVGEGFSEERRAAVKKRVERDAWTVFASVSWAAVMWLFRWHPDVLQPSLRSSMRYLYDNAETWDGVRSWVWHNQ